MSTPRLEKSKSPRWSSSAGPRIALKRPSTAPSVSRKKVSSDSDIEVDSRDEEIEQPIHVKSEKLKPSKRKVASAPSSKITKNEQKQPMTPPAKKGVVFNEYPHADINIEFIPSVINGDEERKDAKEEERAKPPILKNKKAQLRIQTNVATYPSASLVTPSTAAPPVSSKKSTLRLHTTVASDPNGSIMTPTTAQPPISVPNSAVLSKRPSWSSRRLPSFSRDKPKPQKMGSFTSDAPKAPARKGSLAKRRPSTQSVTRAPSKSTFLPGLLPKLQLIAKTSSINSVSTSSDSSSDQDSEELKRIDEIPENPETIPEEVEVPEIENVKPPEEKLPLIAERPPNPMTRMRGSLYNLFSSVTTPFRGPGDAYYKFVLGGKSVRGGAKRLQQLKCHEIDKGKYDKFMVSAAAGKVKVPERHIRAIRKERDRHKDAIRDILSNKANTLEKSRA
jgi:hypothetical protein